jgi:cellulose synthase (UDP-forming)
MKVEFSNYNSGALSLQHGVDEGPSETPSYLVPLMTEVQKWEYATWVVVWIGVLVFFWTWWLQPEHNVGTFGFLSSSGVLAWVTVLPLYFLFFFSRSRLPSQTVPVPAGYRVAMIVTKVPSEPFSLVRQTLEAMLSQGYPHDTWLADEDPSEETIEWCQRNGVRISTRKNCPDYHRATWPRRAHCKEGNLAYFYDHYGYVNYDFVVQMDADHVPSDGYLEEMLRPFADPSVGYVSAPSICDRNAHKSWSARGRLYAEGALHGALQAGYNGGFAPLCIGSHYAVRTLALKRIGGLGPELAEDHSTTLMMNAHGWRGVHAVNAIARGEGPNSFADLTTQEFQWSRSLMTIFLNHTPRYFFSLTPRLRFQFVFAQLWYLSFALMMLIIYMLPIIALTSDKVLVHLSYPYFFLGSSLLATLLVLLARRLKRFGFLRPCEAKILSWEGTLFLFARWPWAFLGVISAIYVWARRPSSDVNFRVTPKGLNKVSSLPLNILWPYIILSMVSGLTVLSMQASSAPGYYVFASLNSITYALILVVILVQHALENGYGFSPKRCLSVRALIVGAVIVVSIAGLSRIPLALGSLLWMRG